MGLPAHRRFKNAAFAFSARRFSRSEHLGLHFTVGILLSVLMLGVFGLLGRYVIDNSWLTSFDADLGLRLQLQRQESVFWRGLFGYITQLGSADAITTITLCFGILLLYRRQGLLTLVWLTAVFGASFLNSTMKEAYERPRPTFFDPIWVHENSMSFPSGHSLIGLVTYGLIAYLFAIKLPRRVTRYVVPTLLLLVVLIGFSRIYLGAHYFSDVLGGFAIGACWLAVIVTAIEAERRRRCLRFPVQQRQLQLEPVRAYRAEQR